MNDREKWWERVRDIRAYGTTWWWWWWLTPVMTFFSLRSVRQQISSELLDSSNYPSWFEQCSGLIGLDSFVYLLFPRSLFDVFGGHSKCPKYDCYQCHLHVSQLFPLSDNVMVVVFQFAFIIGLMGRVFANAPGDLGSTPGRIIPKTFKMVLDTSLLNTQQYKVRIKGKVEQSRERSSALPYISVQ